MNSHASIQVNAVLVAPDPPGSVIRRLRGQVPLIAVTRSSDPVVIRLDVEGVLGKPFSTRDMTLVVDETSLDPGKGRISVKVTIRGNRGVRAAGVRPDPRRPDFAAFNQDRLLEHLGLHDAAGRRLEHGVGEQTRGADRQGFYDRYRSIVTPVLEDGPVGGPAASKPPIPAELRYYEFVQEMMEVPFDFRDIPMP